MIYICLKIKYPYQMGMLKIQYQSNTGLFQSNQLIIIKII
jgi:hypothetical protein